MLRIIRAEDRMLIFQRLEEIKKEAVSKQRISFSFDLENSEERQLLLERVRTDDLFDQDPLLIAGPLAGQVDFIAEIIENNNLIEDRTRELILWQKDSLPAGTATKKFQGLVASSKVIKEDLQAPRGAGLRNWIKDRVAGRGLMISEQALAELSGVFEGNSGFGKETAVDYERLGLEIEKLCDHAVGTQRMTVEKTDVELLVGNPDRLSIFELVDAFAQGDKVSAAICLSRALSRGDDPYFIFSMLARQFRIMTRIKGAARPLANPAKELGIHPFAASKAVTQARKMELPKLIEIMKSLRDLDQAAKSGAQDMTSALYSFLFSL